MAMIQIELALFGAEPQFAACLKRQEMQERAVDWQLHQFVTESSQEADTAQRRIKINA